METNIENTAAPSVEMPHMVGPWLDAGRAYREAVRLAKIMHRRSFAKVAPNWEPLDTTSGVISQIDNMHAGTMDMLNWAESLLCNAAPMSHCTQEEWDAIIRKWRDQKHGVSEPNDSSAGTAEAVGLAALCSVSDLLERAHDMLSRAHIMLDGWPQAVQWHHDYEHLKKQRSWKDHSTATHSLNDSNAATP